MTETSGNTLAMFISAFIVAGVALVVIPKIVEGQVSSADQGNNLDAARELKTRINWVCDGTQDTAEGTLSLTGGATIQLEGSTVNLQGVDTDRSTEWDVSCPISSSQTIEDTKVYTITKSGGEYSLE
ncbi:MAG: hypothetical protein ABEI58_04095 [Candidatus Nanohaloarchaea archaeon]